MQPVHRRPSSVWVDATLRGLDSTALGSTETSPVQNLRFTEIGNTCKIGEKTQCNFIRNSFGHLPIFGEDLELYI